MHEQKGRGHSTEQNVFHGDVSWRDVSNPSILLHIFYPVRRVQMTLSSSFRMKAMSFSGSGKDFADSHRRSVISVLMLFREQLLEVAMDRVWYLIAIGKMRKLVTTTREMTEREEGTRLRHHAAYKTFYQVFSYTFFCIRPNWIFYWTRHFGTYAALGLING